MTDSNYTHYVLITDRSGSMVSVRQEAQDGIRSFITEQAKLPGRATLSFYQFDSVTEKVHDFTVLEKASSYILEPRNMTALLDAVGTAVTEVGTLLAKLPEENRPGKVIVLITTDGHENFSSEFTKTQIKDMITEQREKYGWEFSYVGANVDAFTEASSMGIPANSTLANSGTKTGFTNSYAAASAASTRYRGGTTTNIAYVQEERDEAGK